MAEVLAKDRHALKGCFLLRCLPGLSAMETYQNIRETIKYLPLADYHLFRSLQNSFAGQKFDDRMQVKSYLDNFFSSQPPELYAAGIAQLPQWWQDMFCVHLCVKVQTGKGG
ncbi:hypothetical protein CRE_14307 [Caenorhabditis remanei]|uniref:Uncharacterized protein n=1 Tax=Caenorhabditis remanei TaxID=31234 RepID=E3NEY6_CAERE|nr:hypothetical protein CRE_14307 [Caenorhabditis remanei]